MILYLVESVTRNFPDPTTPKVEGELSFKVIKEIDRNLATNAASCNTDLGGRFHGCQGMSMLPARYLNITGHSFAAHHNIGVLPYFLDKPTHPQTVKTSTTHKEQLRIWREKKSHH